MKETPTPCNDEVKRETGSHGQQWNLMHGGYFASAEIARPFVEKITEIIKISQPEVVADLGGGTGFILDQIASNPELQDIELINLDLSERQLNSLINKKITPHQGSIDSFIRRELDDKGKKFLFISRSALHYSGLHGLGPLLKHIREQMHTGEYFIHQSACFALAEDALLMNLLYELMGTEKWYPPLEIMLEVLTASGFTISSVSAAPPLHLTSESLMERYKFDRSKMGKIKAVILRNFGNGKKTVFDSQKDGFTAKLDYRVFCCQAV